ncbi:beta-glucosidase BglX [Marseilla massiliensis]|jgi:beta-glucosidase|uniref:Periplasmic beta-glucosidase n=1 Tax=Marseilla massiliensis TaxID=1841864 RepID=A0A939B7C6_9BACT|nr:beta-glucosidase BglX [Marseilla massiliensis]MBM6673437.1 beta-glucosidase BglX [Marseilla massiliensis]
MKKAIFSAALGLLSLSATAQDAAMDKFVDDLMSRMTLEEKIGQLNLQVAGDITTGQAQDTQVAGLVKAGKMGGVFNLKGVEKIRELQKMAVEQSRMGIPLLVGMDVIHGYETIFPIPFALSCSWNMEAVEEAARIAAKEASADGINWVFSPMVDICVDARWGRISEGNGEDPYLGSQIARAMIRGYQGDYSSRENVMACLKHYALYGAVEAGLDYNTVDMSRLRMYNQYFPPYKAAVEEGTGSVMSSFNIVDGVPATANRWLLDDVLRKQWKFDGFVATDYGSIGEMLPHGVGGDLKHASALALTAGTDMDMCSMGFIGTLEQSVKDGTVSEEAVNTACRRVLEAKYKLGLFKDPYKYCDVKRRKTDIFTAENRAAARRIAAETFVLLKNKADLLPLKKQGRIALIGPLADTRANMAGTWCVAYTPDKYSTLKEGFERALKGKAELLYAQGCNLMADSARQRAAEFGKTIARGDDARLKAEAIETARQADVIVCAMGESADMSGECASRSDLRLPDVQRELLAELVKLGKPVVMLNFSGRPTVLTWEEANVDAILNVWFGGSEAADAICDVVFGDVAPSGRLTMTFPRATGQVPMYYNHLNTGRPVPEGTKDFRKYATNWLDNVNDPLYPFGYGLTYTTFSYGKPTVTGSGRTFKASVTVTNTGGRDAVEVVQLYVRDPVASIARPVKELKGFSRVTLKAGESRQVTFDITEKDLSYYDAEGRLVFEPGVFSIMLGHDSSSLQSVDINAE